MREKLDKGKRWVDNLRRAKSGHRSKPGNFAPRREVEGGGRSVRLVHNPFFNSSSVGAQQQQQRPPTPATLICQGFTRRPPPPPNQQAPVPQFRPDAPPNTNFTSGVAQVRGGVFEFSGRRNRLVPAMGVRQASRSTLHQQQQQQQAGTGLENVHLPQGLEASGNPAIKGK